MSLRTDVSVLANLLDPPPDIPHQKAVSLLEKYVQRRDIRRLRNTLEIFSKYDPDALEYARENGPEWLISAEGQNWLKECTRISA